MLIDLQAISEEREFNDVLEKVGGSRLPGTTKSLVLTVRSMSG